jgi:hypothetical protein
MTALLIPETGTQHVLVSAPPAELAEKVKAYAVNWARKPDAGSEFEEKVTPLLGLSDEQLFARLIGGGYDGLLLFDETGEIIGHVFYQKHNGWWGVLHVFVTESMRERRYATRMVVDRVIAGMKAELGFMMISKGGDARVARIHEKLVDPANPLQLPFRVQKGNRSGLLVFVRD